MPRSRSCSNVGEIPVTVEQHRPHGGESSYPPSISAPVWRAVRSQQCTWPVGETKNARIQETQSGVSQPIVGEFDFFSGQHTATRAGHRLPHRNDSRCLRRGCASGNGDSYQHGDRRGAHRHQRQRRLLPGSFVAGRTLRNEGRKSRFQDRSPGGFRFCGRPAGGGEFEPGGGPVAASGHRHGGNSTREYYDGISLRSCRRTGSKRLTAQRPEFRQSDRADHRRVRRHLAEKRRRERPTR